MVSYWCMYHKKNIYWFMVKGIPEVPNLGGSGAPSAPYNSKLKLSGNYASLYSKQAHLNHGLNVAIKNRSKVIEPRNHQKNAQNGPNS